MKQTPAYGLVREELGRAFVVAAYDGQLVPEIALAEHWLGHPEEQGYWLSLVDTVLADSHPLASALTAFKREAFEAGSSPAVGVLLFEIQQGPAVDDYSQGFQDGLSRAVSLLIEEVSRERRSAFEAGVRLGRAQHQAQMESDQDGRADGR